MINCIKDTPAYDLRYVAELAGSGDVNVFTMTKQAADGALGYCLDDVDVRAWLASAPEHKAKGDLLFQKCSLTRKWPPNTCSDYYLAQIPECGTNKIFLKFVINEGVLIITSFKDDDYGD